MTNAKLQKVLELHKLWLESHPGGERANLQKESLNSMDLGGINLQHALMNCTNLRGSNLRGANLRGASLIDARIDHADLAESDLLAANLTRATLHRTNLLSANLLSADLSEAILTGAGLKDAKLTNANLSNTVLSEVHDLRVASCHWTGHGERGRLINAAEIDGEIKFFCGCFNGNEAELREFIANGASLQAKSRIKALEFLLSCF